MSYVLTYLNNVGRTELSGRQGEPSKLNPGLVGQGQPILHPEVRPLALVGRGSLGLGGREWVVRGEAGVSRCRAGASLGSVGL